MIEIMNSKYYTPDITEFHIGFEYEYGAIKNTVSWQKIIADWQELDIVFDDYEHDEDFKDIYRVKYLDKDDIENLGFKEVQDLEPTPGMYIKITEGGYFNVNYIYFNSWDSITIYDWDQDIIFRGIIRNKSELARLMLQLGINGE